MEQQIVLDWPKVTQFVRFMKLTLSRQEVFKQRQTLERVKQAPLQLGPGRGDRLESLQPHGRGPENRPA
ncbi:hypothetical protein D3C87_1738100 [compost metagenome]